MPEAVPPAKLPFWRTIGESYAIWFKNLPELIRIAWIWLLIMVPIVGLFMWWQAPAMMELMQNARAGRPDPNPGMTALTQAINSIILLPILSSIAVAWHRLLLRDEHVSGPYLRLDSVVIGYAVLFFLIALLFVGAAISRPDLRGDDATTGSDRDRARRPWRCDRSVRS